MIMASATGLSPAPSANIIPSSSFNQILQSDSVRRLFNQPNIVIHAIPRTNSPTVYRMIKPKSPVENEIDENEESEVIKGSESTIQNKIVSESVQCEDDNLLPSKTNGKSEILLVPIKRERKACGHFEPCESLLCDVIFQQYEDEDGITPLISVNIESDEEEDLDGPIEKHCEKDKCDALSIDHNSCRRACVELFNCDKLNVCDICGVIFEDSKARMNHKKCRRKTGYQHNKASPTEIFKYRMRERELQILEAARLKKSEEFLDPVTGFNRTMEALMKKDELIVIPKMASKVQNSSSFNNNYHHSNNNYRNRRRETGDKELTSEMISNIIQSCKESIDMKNRSMKNSSKQIMLSDHLNGGTVNIIDSPVESNEPPIDYEALSMNGVKITPVSSHQRTKLAINTGLPFGIEAKPKRPNIIKTGSVHKNSKQKHQLKTKSWMVSDELLSTPYKIIRKPDIQSDTSMYNPQGVPNYNTPLDHPLPTIKPLKSIDNKKFGPKKKKQALLPKVYPKTSKILTSVKFRPLQPNNVRNMDVQKGTVRMTKKQRGRKRTRKKLIKKGKFRCTHCPKRFSTIEYCKIHIAKHENNPGFFCRLCEKGFLNKYIMKKHMDIDHKPGQVRCEICHEILSSLQELCKHMKDPDVRVERQCPDCSDSFDTCSDLDFHMKLEHGFLNCSICKYQVAKSNISRHLMLEHSFSKTRSENHFEKLSYPPGENEEVKEIELIPEIVVKEEVVIPKTETKPKIENKVEVADCLARNRSVRRRNSKELFLCAVCDRRFENEKQYQIHLANNPMKFTLCPVCGKKFHRKSEYTEHSKTCNRNGVTEVAPTPKKRRSNPINNEIILKNEDNDVSENSIQQRLTESLGLMRCKKVKLSHDKIIHKEIKEDLRVAKKIIQKKVIKKDEDIKKDDEFVEKEIKRVARPTKKIMRRETNINDVIAMGEIQIVKKEIGRDKNTSKEIVQSKKEEIEDDVEKMKNEEIVQSEIQEEGDLLKNSVEIRVLNGLKKNSHDCLEILKTESDIEHLSGNEGKKFSNENVLLLSAKKVVDTSNNSQIIDKSAAISSIFQDHNYQATIS